MDNYYSSNYDQSGDNRLLSDDYEAFVEALELLYIRDNLSGRLNFAKMWPAAASQIFDDELRRYDHDGADDRDRWHEVQDEAEDRRIDLLGRIEDVEVNSVDKGALQVEFVQELVQGLGRDLALLVYSEGIVNRFLPGAEAPADESTGVDSDLPQAPVPEADPAPAPDPTPTPTPTSAVPDTPAPPVSESVVPDTPAQTNRPEPAVSEPAVSEPAVSEPVVEDAPSEAVQSAPPVPEASGHDEPPVVAAEPIVEPPLDEEPSVGAQKPEEPIESPEEGPRAGIIASQSYTIEATPKEPAYSPPPVVGPAPGMPQQANAEPVERPQERVAEPEQPTVEQSTEMSDVPPAEVVQETPAPPVPEPVQERPSSLVISNIQDDSFSDDPLDSIRPISLSPPPEQPLQEPPTPQQAPEPPVPQPVLQEQHMTPPPSPVSPVQPVQPQPVHPPQASDEPAPATQEGDDKGDESGRPPSDA